MPSPARLQAFAVLQALHRNRGTLADLLADADSGLSDQRERAFLHELVLGTLRARGRLDYVLATLVDRPLERLDPATLEVLRLGTYQVLDLRVPDRAAVSESVDLVRTAAPAAGGFVNAVLRRLVRQGAPSLPDADREPLAWLTSAGSLPLWLAERWLARLGPAAAVARARALLGRPRAALRLNPRRSDAAARAAAAGLDLRALAVPGAFEAQSGNPAALAEEGLLALQDEGSQLIAHLASRPGRLLDACAAPGGKAMLMGDLGPDRMVFAVEPATRRRATMARLLARWGSRSVLVLGADAQRPPFAAESFDGLLLDAPCSGLGTLGRHPDIRWRTTPGDLARHPRRQALLLRSLAPLVRHGGLLVYATCSSEPEENERVLEGFLAETAGFELEALPEWARGFADGPFARTGRVSSDDAFFAALLRRA
jgi:16S rRNA (cytosine967-C5)-methyltransferase